MWVPTAKKEAACTLEPTQGELKASDSGFGSKHRSRSCGENPFPKATPFALEGIEAAADGTGRETGAKDVARVPEVWED